MRDSRGGLVVLLLAGLVVAAFLPVLGNGFVEWDDKANFLDNPAFHGVGADSVGWAWSTGHLGVYQPLSWMLLLGQHSLWGLEPAGYHAVSLLLHVVNTVVLYFLTLAILPLWRPEWESGRGWPLRLSSALAVALFALHPLRTEVVAWVSCQPYLPCILCCQLSALAYLHSQASGSRRWWWASLGLFTAALLFKAAALPLPAILLLLEMTVLRRGRPDSTFRSALKAPWPFFVLSLIFLAIALRVRTVHPPGEHDSLLTRLLIFGNSVGFYWGKMLLPAGLAILYPIPAVGNMQAILVSGMVLLAGVLLFALRRRLPGTFVVGLAYLLLLLPTAGLLSIGLSVTADRYSYLATLGCCIGLAGLLRRAQGGQLRPALAGAVVTAALVCSVLSWRQSRTWHDSETLWKSAVAGGARGRADAHACLGNLLVREHRIAEGIPYLQRAVELEPALMVAQKGLGCALVQEGDYAGAVAHLVKALDGESDDPESLRVLGVALARLDRRGEAIACLARSVGLDPSSAEAQRNLGLLRFQQGDLDGAEGPLAQALRLDPEHAEAHHALGVICARSGRAELAVRHWSEALRIRPNLIDAHKRAGMLLLEQGRSAEALAHYSQALHNQPSDVEILNGMGMALGLQGKLDQAVEKFRQALAHDPNNADVRHNLGSALARQGRWQEAMDAFAEVLRLQPSHEPARRNLERVRQQVATQREGQ